MKKVFFVPVFIFMAFSIWSCENDSLDPLPVKVEGQFVKMDVSSRVLDFANIDNAAFRATISAPAGGVSKYELLVRRTDKDGNLTGDYVPMQTITSFPSDLVITPQLLATALGLNVSDLLAGETYAFFAYSYDAAGNRVSYLNLSRLIQVTPSMKQAYRFKTVLGNPSTLDPIENPYNIYGDL